jgi:hypothetical protein
MRRARVELVAGVAFLCATATYGQEPPALALSISDSLAHTRAMTPSTCRVDLSAGECRIETPKAPSWTVHAETMWDPPSRGDLAASADWKRQLTVGSTFRAPGGVNLTFGVTGRQHYAMPLVAVRPLGSDAYTADMSTSLFGPSDREILWDSTLRVEKVLKDIGAVHVKAVGELFNLLDADAIFGRGRRKPDPNDLSPAMLRQRSARFGLVLSF